MDISKIRAYDEIWFDCEGNLLLSILLNMNEKYRPISFFNDSKYICRLSPTDTGDFNMLETETSWECIGNLFSEGIPIEYEDDDIFLNTIKEKLSEGYAVFVGLDLFYWIEQNFCYNKEHWFHNTMIHSYDPIEDTFYVFEVSDDKTYGIFPISVERFMLAIHKGLDVGYKSFYCTINNQIDVNNITIDMILKNAQERIDNIKEVQSSKYWGMSIEEYKKGAYESLNLVFLGRIVQRFMANNNLYRSLMDRGFLSQEQADLLIDTTEKLIRGWSMIRTRVNMLFLIEEVESEIEKLNNKLKPLFDLEIEVWTKFISYIEVYEKKLIVYSFD